MLIRFYREKKTNQSGLYLMHCPLAPASSLKVNKGEGDLCRFGNEIQILMCPVMC